MYPKAVLIDEEELNQIIDRRVEEKVNSFKALFKKDQEDKPLDGRRETAKRLNVSLPTLDKLVKTGDIPAIRIGARVLFRRTEVDAAVKQIKSDKFYNSKA